MLDCTSSMGPYIEAARNQIKTIIEDTRRATGNVNFRVAFVGYRDIEDKNRGSFITFTPMIDTITSILFITEPEGGYDTCEDVAGGFDLAMIMDWKDADVRTLVHIADAPCHGKDFHTKDVWDNHPDNDYGILDKCLALVNNGIDYTFVKINDSTDIMYDKFSEIYAMFPERTCQMISLPHDVDPDIMERTLSAELTRTITSAVTQHTSAISIEED